MENIHSAIAVGFIISGLIGFLMPAFSAKIKGIDINDLKGRVEIQAVYGGIFFGLGLATLIINERSSYFVLGIACFCAGIARFLSLIQARAQIEMNVSMILMILEIIAGVVLILH